MKFIIIDTPKGQYQLELQKVAEHRADYYACEVDGHEKYSTEWKEEVGWVMEDNFEGIDWLTDNTNWKDWENYVIKINNKVNVTDDDFWYSTEGFEIVEKKTSKDWEESIPKEYGFKILDPDGWNRNNYEYSFNQELITKDEFKSRLSGSTIMSNRLFSDNGW